jgi:hypothetical protein
MNNSSGKASKYSIAQSMNAYDRLPKKVRLALMYADHNWCAGSVRYVMTSKKYKKKSDEVIQLLKLADERRSYEYMKESA